MRKSIAEGPGGKRAYIPAMGLLAVALGLLVWAFFQRSLTPDQKALSNLFYALVLSIEGFLVGGILINVKGKLRSNVMVTIRAIGGAAGLLLALWHPLFAAGPAGERTAPAISEPVSGAMVGRTVEVSGFAPHAEMRLYVVVTGPMGGDTVQDEVVKVAEDGRFRARAALGSAGAGAGQRYLIRVVATNAVLAPGAYNLPGDAVVSEAVAVIRVGEGSGTRR